MPQWYLPAMSLEYVPLEFPRDGRPHNNIIEWWYFNGHLSDKDGNDFFFMNCLFKADVNKVNIPFLKMIPIRDLYFHHHLLSEVSSGRNFSRTSPYVTISKDSFLKPLFFINYMRPTLDYYNYEIREIEPFHYRIKTEDFDLIMESQKEPLLEGGDWFLKLNSRDTYYYSLTNMKITGHVLLDGSAIEVEGKGWVDRQWADTPYINDIWTWFSIQLDNGTELICFEYDDYKVKDHLADFIDKDGNTMHSRVVEMIPRGNPWISKATGGKFHLSWDIKIPSMDIFRSWGFWESLIRDIIVTNDGELISSSQRKVI
jgi:predicted secreted hydrolase